MDAQLDDPHLIRIILFILNGEQVVSGRIERTIAFVTGTEPVDVGMDDLTTVTHDYQQYDNNFTGRIHKIVVGVGPVGEAFDPRLEWHKRGSVPLPASALKSFEAGAAVNTIMTGRPKNSGSFSSVSSMNGCSVTLARCT